MNKFVFVLFKGTCRIQKALLLATLVVVKWTAAHAHPP